MTAMPDKRKPSTSASGSPPYAKRTRASYAETGDDYSSNTSTYERPRNDPTYGQTSAFPGLEDSAGDELFYGPAEDGIEYLRMVRSEANSLPSFFATAKGSDTSATTATTATMTAAKSENTPPDEAQDNQPKQGIYTDGVYIGPSLTDTPSDTKTTPKQKQKQKQKQTQTNPQETYHNLLRHRFHLLRTTLNCYPPADAISALDASHPISLPRHSTPARKEWRRLLLSEEPQMVQLACMDMGSVLGVLGIMGRLMSEHVRCGDKERVRRFGAWAWGLLGRCREVGQLGTEEVGEIRDLGKRAVRILVKMREEEQSGRGKLEGERSESHGRHHNQDQDRGEEDGEESGNDHGNEPPSSNDAKPAKTDTGTDQPQRDHGMPDAEAEAEPEGQISPDADENEEDLEAAKVRLQQKLQSSDIYVEPQKGQQNIEPEQPVDGADVSRQARAMLDMIITVVGEYYGQRDLLAAREVWQEDVQVC